MVDFFFRPEAVFVDSSLLYLHLILPTLLSSAILDYPKECKVPKTPAPAPSKDGMQQGSIPGLLRPKYEPSKPSNPVEPELKADSVTASGSSNESKRPREESLSQDLPVRPEKKQCAEDVTEPEPKLADVKVEDLIEPKPEPADIKAEDSNDNDELDSLDPIALAEFVDDEDLDRLLGGTYEVDATDLITPDDDNDELEPVVDENGLIRTALNYVKGKYPAITLPLVATWMNSHNEPDFEKRKSQWSWAYNTVSNCAILYHIFEQSKGRESQVKTWTKWSPNKLRAALEALRTGTKTDEVTQALSRCSVDELFKPRAKPEKQQFDRRQGYIQQGQRVYPTMLQIAGRYGLTQEEFDYYFTLPAPNRRARWVILEICVEMVKNMQANCNHNAGEAGLGEKELDGMACMFWMAHFL
ncbi:hypothetical protein NM208_g1789 [Fusarium decemcellulare]|uniref:Uncharacterized protein n=1 Tax=Fusarium decemcellulare TaxID=57161 RepID=A0ACC1SV01_9HYPO|nr:hypothetical protein NM208_g1789 [Fusarium decemcellulare]